MNDKSKQILGLILLGSAGLIGVAILMGKKVATSSMAASFNVIAMGDLSYTFTPIISGGVAPYTYSWSMGDGGTSTEKAPQYTYSGVDIYSVSLTVTDKNGLVAKVSKTLQLDDDGGVVSGDLLVSLKADVSQGLTVGLTPIVTGGVAPYTYSWDFGVADIGTDISTEELPYYNYPGSGTYYVTLSVTDADGSSATITQEITVFKGPITSIPGVQYYNHIVYFGGDAYRDNVYIYGGYEYHTFIHIVTREEGLGYMNDGIMAGTPVSAKTGNIIDIPPAYAIAAIKSIYDKLDWDGVDQWSVDGGDRLTDQHILVGAAYTTLKRARKITYPEPKPTVSQTCKTVVEGNCGVLITASDGKTWEIDLGPFTSAWQTRLAPYRAEAQAYEDTLNLDWDYTLKLSEPISKDIIFNSMNLIGQSELWSLRGDGKVYYQGQARAWIDLNEDRTMLKFYEV